MRDVESAGEAKGLQKGKEQMPATAVKPKRMTVSEIKNKAKGLGINPGTLNKSDLIHAIQRAENHTPCFGWNDGSCIHVNCCFMPDCHRTKR